MGVRSLCFCLLLVVTILVVGCYSTPVRHLTADVALLKVGQSTEEDVLVYLGRPDMHRDLGNGVVEFYYRDENEEFLEKAPMVGKYLGSPEYIQVIVTLTWGIVSGLDYSSTDEDDIDWRDDFSWQN